MTNKLPKTSLLAKIPNGEKFLDKYNSSQTNETNDNGLDNEKQSFKNVSKTSLLSKIFVKK